MCTYSHLNNFDMNILIVEDYNWHGKRTLFCCCAKYVCLWKSKRNDHLKTQEKEKLKKIYIIYKWHINEGIQKKGRRIYEGI